MPMKTSSGGKQLDGVAARNCFFLNQLATPGLGSLMAGKTASGLGQLALALAGFALVIAWFALTMIEAYQQFNSETPAKSYGWVGAAGALVFIAAWLWSLGTSFSLLRQARTLEAAAQKNIPPRIDEVPGGGAN